MAAITNFDDAKASIKQALIDAGWNESAHTLTVSDITIDEPAAGPVSTGVLLLKSGDVTDGEGISTFTDVIASLTFTVDTSTTQGKNILKFSKVEMKDLATNYKTTLDSETISEFVGVETLVDNVIIKNVATAGFTLKTIGKDTGTSKADVVTIEPDTAGVTIDGATSSVVGAGGLTLNHGDASITLTNSTIAASGTDMSVSGGEDELVLGAGATLLDLTGTVDGGNVTIEGGLAAGTNQKINMTVSDGTFTNKIDKLGASSTIDASGGSYSDTSLKAGKGSLLQGFTKNAGAYTAAADGSVLKIVGGEVSSAVSFNMSANTSTSNKDEVTITDLSANVTHTVSGGGATLNLTKGKAATGIYTVGMDATNTVGITNGEMKIDKNGAANLIVEKNSVNAKEWAFSGNAGAVVVNTGTTSGNDTINVGGTMNGFTLTSGTGADTITFDNGMTAGGTDAVSISAAKGNDIFDVHNLGTNTAYQNITVEYGYGTGQDTGTEDLGFDGIFVGEEVQESKMKWDAVNGLIVNGVKFSVAEGQYVKFGYDTSKELSENTQWSVYYTDATAENGLVYVGGGSSDSGTESTEGYTAIDSTKTDEVKDTAGTGKKDGNFDGAIGTAASDKLAAANATFKAINDDTAKKYVELDTQDWSGTGKSLDMGSKGTSYVLVDSLSAAAGTLEMGGSKKTENNIVLKGAGTADVSKVTFKDYNSTKDVLIAPITLDNYATDPKNYSTNDFINFSDGTYGKDLVLSAGTLGANSVKGGMYSAKFRQAQAVGGEISRVDSEVMVVAGAAATGSFDGTNVSTQIFAMTNNNEDIADNVTGSKNKDVFIAGKNDTVDGGKGNDTVYADEKAVTVMLATGKETDNDVIYGWKANTGTIQLAEGKDFSNISVGGFDVGNSNAFEIGDGSSNNAFATFQVSNLNNATYTKIKNGDGVSKTALIFDGVAANAAVTGLVADSIPSVGLYVGSDNGKNLLDFEGSGKGNIFLGHSEGTDAEFGDKAQYVNVKNVKSDTVGGAWVFGGGSNQVTLAAGGDDDSLWGAGKKNDTLISNGTYRTSFGTTNGSGIDVLQNFKFGADAYGETTDTDVVYFVDGVDLSKVKVSDGKFIVGSNDTSALAFEISSASGRGTSDGALITYGLGLGGPKNVAKVDVTTTAGDTGTVTFEEDATLYIGRGEKTTLTFDSNNGNPVRFGFDSKYSGYKVGTLDGSEAVAGSLINGSTDRAQKVMASENGASSIAGGFGDGFVDSNSDTLIGGGENDFGTTFFVGKDMGSDNIQNLSDGDTVVFLNTKVSDITNNINSDTYGKNVSVSFNTGNRITATSTNNIADLEGVTVKFNDGTFTYDGVSKSWVRANA